MKKMILILFVILSISLEYYNYLNHPQVLGIFLDIIGAYYLGQSFVTKNLDDIVCESWGSESNKYPGGLSDNLGISLYQRAIEARTGFIILTIGFIIQGVSITHPDWEIIKCLGGSLVILLLITVNIIHSSLLKPDRIVKKMDDRG